MPIDYGRLRRLTARELITALERDGFERRSSHGAHRRFRHADGRRVTVSYHRSGNTFPVKTLKSIIEKQAQWTEDDLIRLGLVK